MTTTFLFHGTALTLAYFAAVSLLTSVFVLSIAHRPLQTRSSTFWFGLRLLPALAALAFVTLVFVPSYWRYEPRETTEAIDVTTAVLASIGLLILVSGAARGASAWWRARTRTHDWMNRSRELCLRAAGARRSMPPTFVIDADAPIMALVGLLRPRLLATRGLIEALTDEELAAAIAHEVGHSRARDNLKRLVMRAAPDLLAVTPAARAVERRWVSAAEHAADRMCNAATPALRYALASALVKVARLMPPEPTMGEPISTLIGGGEIASRVRVLLDDRVAPPASRYRTLSWLCAAAVMLAAFVVAYQPLLHSMHELTEVVVQAVP